MNAKREAMRPVDRIRDLEKRVDELERTVTEPSKPVQLPVLNPPAGQ